METTTAIRGTYSTKALAKQNALPYCNKEKEDIYVWESNIGPNQKEYIFKKRSDLIRVNSPFIVHVQKYDPRNAVNMKLIVKNGLRQLVPVHHDL